MDEVIKLQSSYNLGSLIRCWIKRLVSSFEAIFMTLSLCRSFWCQKIIDLFFQSNITIRVFFSYAGQVYAIAVYTHIVHLAIIKCVSV